MQVVWFSEIKWDYLKTRKHQIISRKPADVELLFLEPVVKGRRNRFSLRREGNIHCATVPFVKSAPTFPWRSILDRRIARRVVDRTAHWRIRDLFRRLDFDSRSVGFVISNIYAADIVLSMPRRCLLYDCNDDHSSFPGMRSWTEAYFYKTTRSADAVFASSRALLEKIVKVRGGSDGASYLGNGVDYHHFESVTPATDKPRLGYVGALAPWVDFDAVAAVARQHPEWEFIFVGPILLGVEDDVARVTSLPNVFHLAAVPYDRLPEVLAQFSLGLIPFRYNELTRGVNPNKLYEYLAAGLPVVSTRFSTEVQRYDDVTRAVDPGDDFVAACEDMIGRLANASERSAIVERARAIARENDWNAIAGLFWNKLATMMGSRSDTAETGK